MSIRNNCRKLFIRLNPRIEYDTKKTQIDNITNKFANGEIDYNNCISQLAALGVTATALSESSIRFSYKNKTYTITQKNATTSTPTYTLSQLQNSYKFSDEIINKYFKKQNVSTSGAAGAKQNSGNIDKYVVNTSSGCKTISDVEKIAAKQYQKDMVLTNFLNDMNKQTNSVSNMQKASDGKEITKDNYKDYVKEITATLGTDTDAAKQKALDKLIKDYTQGNIAFTMMSTLFEAIGITDAKAVTKGSGTKTGVTFEFSFNGKSYKMSCNIFASLSGTDKKTVNTYSANELKNIGATSKQIDKYFESISSIDGKSNTYKLRSGKTYTAFLKEVNTNPKNGDYTTTNSAGNTVITTYKNNVKTKEVEYDKNGKVANETIYNKDGSKVVTEFTDGVKSKVTTYDKNGKVTKTDKYDKNGNLIKNGDYTTTNNAGNKVVTTYKDGVKTKEVEYDKNNKVLNETVYNSNGTKTVTAYSDGVKSKVTTYDKNGNVTKSENYDKNGNLIQDGEVKTTNAKGNKVYTTYKNGVAIKEVEYDKQTGNLVSVTTFKADGSKTVKEYSDKYGEYYTVSNYNKDGKITDSKSMRINYVTAETVYTYNKNGELETKAVTQYDGSGYRDKISTTITDKNGNKISETQYNIYWTNPITGSKSNYSLNVTTTYNGTKTTISAVDKRSGKKDTEITTDSANNTTTVVDYSSKGIKTSSVTTDADKNVLEEIKYDSTGKLSSKVSYEYQNGKLKTRIEYDKNGNVKTKTVYEYSEDGNTIKTKVYDAKGNLTSNTETTKSLDKNNREVLKTKTYNSNNKYVSTTNSYWSSDGESRYEDVYNAKDNGLISSRKVYNKKGEVKNSYTYTYKDVVDNRNYTRITNGNITATVKNGITTKQVTKKSNGDIYTELFDEKTGKHTKSFYYTKSTGAVKTTEYNSKGQKLSDAKNRIPKSDAIAGETTKIYEAIANVDGRMYIGVSNLYAIKKGGAGDISIKLLRMAAKNYNSTPSGATKLNSVSQVDSKYREYVSNTINNTLGYLGYDSSIVKGYLFSNTSDIAKAMAKDSDLKNYVKKNIKALVNGQDVKNICLEFKSNKDLYNSFHNTTVVDSSLSGTKLTLTVMDIYDFNPNAQGSSNSAKLNRIASAAMKDGEIKPYYTLTKVTIDLTSLGFTAAQIQAMKS